MNPLPVTWTKGAAAAFGVAVLLLAPGTADAAVRSGPSVEYAVKANYLVKFAAFVQWPATAHASAQSPVAICVLGRDPFGQVLDRAAAAHNLDGRQIVTRRVTRVDSRTSCHVLYVGDSSEQSAAEALAVLARAPVLTVTDAARTRQRGVIHFVIAGNKVRFHIDQQLASQGGLTISSRLLSLALSVRQR